MKKEIKGEFRELSALSDKLPAQWKDDEARNVLYAPFRSESVNPTDYKHKLQFWTEAINLYCQEFQILTFKLMELRSAFKNDGKYPHCLEAVIQTMLKNGELHKLEDFLLSSQKNNSWGNWATNLLIRSPMKLIQNRIFPASSNVNLNQNEVFVHLKTLEDVSNKLYADLLSDEKEKEKCIFHYNEILEKCQINSHQFKLILHYWKEQGQACVKDLNLNKTEKERDLTENKLIVKLGRNKGQITDFELNVFILQEAEEKLSKEIHKLEEQTFELKQKAKEHLKKEFKQTAKTFLIKKRVVEKKIVQTSGALSNVSELLFRLQSSLLDKELIEVCKTSLTSLDSLLNNKNGELNIDNVSSMMSNLAELCDLQDDVQKELNINNALSMNDGNESELEEELEALLAEEREAEKQANNGDMKELEEAFKDLSLPKVPSNSPPSDRQEKQEENTTITS